MKNVCIVGAGIAGLFSAKMLATKGINVRLFEAAPEVGGLLRSFKSSLGQDFDFGTHIMRQTGVPEIDHLLFSSLSEQWQSFPVLKTGSVVNGKLYSKSPFMNANDLEPDVRESALADFLAIKVESTEGKSALDYLRRSFGQGLTEYLFSPALEKFFAADASSLHQNALAQFGMTRVVAFDESKTESLKKQAWYDQRLAFHSYEQGASGLMNFYPQQGGIGLFVEELKNELVSMGVSIECGQRIESVQSENGRILSLRSNGETVSVDHLVWTLPILALNKLCGASVSPSKLAFRDVALFYFTFKDPLHSDLFYIMNFDPNFRSFRVTLYQNLKGGDDQFYSCCVEVLGSKEELETLNSNLILTELKELKLVDEEEVPVDQIKKLIPFGFPVLTNEFVVSSRGAYLDAKRLYQNVSFVGKSSGKVFFMNDVLIDTFESLRKL